MKNFIYLFFLNLYLCEKNINVRKPIFFQQAKKKQLSENILIQPTSKKKNAILGLIWGYSIFSVLPFFESLNSVDFKNCDVIIFVKNISRSVLNYLKIIGVFIYEISEEYKNISVTKLRWKLYIDFLKEKRNIYNLIFITDIRDTIFQKDIFKYYENNNDSFLGVALEDGTLTHYLNKKWIINFAGEEKYAIIKDQRIICFGTLWGTLDIILKFLFIFWEKLKSNHNSTDQGIGNYLFYYEKIFKEYLIKSDNFGQVITIGLTPRENIYLDSNNNILNFKGEIASVIHQYDRKPDIISKINSKFLVANKTRINIFIDFFKSEQNDKIRKNNIIIFFILLESFTIIIFLKEIISLNKFKKISGNIIIRKNKSNIVK